MSHNSPHKWVLRISAQAKQTFDTLPASSKQGIFRKLKELLEADDPYTLPFVEMLKAKQFNRIRKFRVGDYRLFFVIEAVEVTHQNYTYQGSFFVIDIRDRKDAY